MNAEINIFFQIDVTMFFGDGSENQNFLSKVSKFQTAYYSNQVSRSSQAEFES